MIVCEVRTTEKKIVLNLLGKQVRIVQADNFLVYGIITKVTDTHIELTGKTTSFIELDFISKICELEGEM